MNADVIIFDFDGTLADSAPVMVDCANELAEKYRYPKTGDWHKNRNKSAKELLRESGISWYRLPFFMRDMKRMFRSRMASVQPFDGIKEMLDALDRDKRLLVLTSNKFEVVQAFLKRNRLEYFDRMECNIPLFGKGKALQRLLKSESLSADDVVYVGDEVRDVEACHQVAVPVVAVTWGMNTRQRLMELNPGWLADSPNELVGILQNNKSPNHSD
ncbi:HAD hydrolase-like protein [Prolixibacter sp. SD074]|jgi:phosphoglycolate phosphatase-like HAD superfamily hydrolase|uniref:HAD hydrolase-like protein n=1 Tax=Prolixibacter sp. SD074 TaxID=2652391 RepID=UPI0012725270|nr:HAD hydrolase-like protein [Prolixibacter sp. SD074]GET30703.1 phosphoglycolate phosphatase [Prolixibacter sp. SD074]